MVTVVALYCKNVKLQLPNTDSVVDYVLQLKEIGSRNYSFYLFILQDFLLLNEQILWFMVECPV